MTKEQWLEQRKRILTGTLNDEDLQRFYDVFVEKCGEDYKKTDFTTFQQQFTGWFRNPVSFKDGLPVVTPQNTIVHNMIRYYDSKYHVIYLYDKDKNFIKAY